MVTDDDEDDDYFSEVDDDAELTGLEPKFVRIDGLDILPADLMNMKVDELVPLYIACRNQLATDTRGYKARRARIKTFQGMISMALREKADTVGTDTFKGPYGTAFRQTKEKFSISDWAKFTDWLNQTQNFQAVQKRVAANAVKEIREAEGSLPPGVEVFTEVEFSVRSPSAKRK
jgi:hypothetical protein